MEVIPLATTIFYNSNFLLCPQAYPETRKKTWAQDKKSQSWDNKRVDKANFGK